MSAVIEAPARPAVAPMQLQLQEPQTDPPNGPSTSAQQQQDQGSSQVGTAAAPGLQSTSSRYCCYFLHRLLDFRVPELRALADMYGVRQLEIEPIPEGEDCVMSPYARGKGCQCEVMVGGW